MRVEVEYSSSILGVEKKFTNIRSLNVRNFNIAMLKYMYKLERKDGDRCANF